MRAYRQQTGIMVTAVFALAAVCAAGEKVENWENGKPKRKYQVNAEGKRHGRCQEFYESGVPKLSAYYKDGVLHGRYTSFRENGKRKVSCTYKNGKLDGKYTAYDEKGRTRFTAVYKGGLLDGAYKLATAGKPFPGQVVPAKKLFFVRGRLAYPKPLNYLKKMLARIDPAGPAAFGRPGPRQRPRAGRSGKSKKTRKHGHKKGGRGGLGDFGGDFPPAHVLALQRLRAYRFICDLPYTDVVLDAELNKYGSAGAEICAAIGHLDHHPKNPGWPDKKYKYAYYATSHANLHMSSAASGDALIPGSVDGYMNDSDKSNIDRVGHRRWCLNPGMLKVGFGSHGHFSAMMAHDNSRTPPPDWDLIYYPARGYMPARYISAMHAWCVLLNPKKYEKPTKTGIKARVYVLDKKYRRPGEALALNYFNVETTGFGHNWAIIFRPQGASVRAGNRYWVEVEGVKRKDGKPRAIAYLVEFVDTRGRK